MKKIMAATLSLLACAVLLAGCNISSENNEEQSLKAVSYTHLDVYKRQGQHYGWQTRLFLI